MKQSLIAYILTNIMQLRTFIKRALYCALALTFMVVASAASTRASTYVVTRSDDRNTVCNSGVDCSLREAINAASTAPGDDTIVFAANVTVVTLSDELAISNPNFHIFIYGRGANVFTIDGGPGTNRVFNLSSTTVTLTDVTITGGNGGGGNLGGAILVTGGRFNLLNSIVSGNSTLTSGGAIATQGFASLYVSRTTITGNSAADGGGLLLGSFVSLVDNSTISGNMATGAVGGGGARIVGDVFVRNSTFVNNTTAGNGGGILNAGLISVTNTIIAGNFDTSTGNSPDVSGSFNSSGYNHIGDASGSTGFNDPGDVTGALSLGPLQNNGGKTLTHALPPGSPAIDTGNTATARSVALSTDQRGFARIVDGDGNSSVLVDKGAYEFNSVMRRPFDFDGDGKTDIVVFRPSNSFWYLRQSTAGLAFVNFGLSGDRIVPADYDGDGKTDIAVYRDGVWHLLRSQLGYTAVFFGTSTDLPDPADFDGDGKAELAVFRPESGTWFMYNLANGSSSAVAFGTNGDIPVAADYDSDGRGDVAVFRPSTGAWYLQRSQTGFTGVAFGANGDKPVPADYDGDGLVDVAVFRNGTWYVLRSTLGFTAEGFGLATDLAVPGDYDGDERADLAVFRPSSGSWFLQQSTAGFTGVMFGSAEDKPAPNAYVP